MKISAVVVTFNEEKNIKKCLDSLKFCSEIIIVDSGSTDATLRIAKKCGARIFYKQFSDFSSIKNFGITKAKNQWILSIDADEEISNELQKKIKIAITNVYDGYYIRRINYFLGKPIKYSGWGNDFQLRLFKKNKGSFYGSVHESVKLKGKSGYIRDPIFHYSYIDSRSYFEKMNRYTSIQAQKTKPFLILKLFFSPFFKFIKMFFIKLGFLDGFHGFVLAVYSSFSEFIKISKMIENKNRLDKDLLLVRTPDWIGDCVMLTAFLPQIRKKFKRVCLLTKPKIIELFNGNPNIDEIIEIKPGFIGFFKTISEIKKRKIKLAMSFKPSLSSHILLFFSGVKFKYGYADDMGDIFLNKTYKRKEKYKEHIINDYKNLLYLLDNSFDFSEINQELYIDKQIEKKIIKKSRKIISIAPFNAYGPSKQWSLCYYEELIKTILKNKKNIYIYILGSKSEKEIKIDGEILNHKKVMDLRGCSLRYTMIIIKNSIFFVGNDSGLSHIADAFKIPSIIIFGAIPPYWAGPMNKTSKIIYKNLSCQPCFKKECKYRHYECLHSIKPEEVIRLTGIF